MRPPSHASGRVDLARGASDLIAIDSQGHVFQLRIRQPSWPVFGGDDSLLRTARHWGSLTVNSLADASSKDGRPLAEDRLSLWGTFVRCSF